MQGVIIKAYDPATGDGLVMSDTDLDDYELAANVLEGSIFRMLRQGQRVVFRTRRCRPGHAAATRLRGRHEDSRRLRPPRPSVAAAGLSGPDPKDPTGCPDPTPKDRSGQH